MAVSLVDHFFEEGVLIGHHVAGCCDLSGGCMYIICLEIIDDYTQVILFYLRERGTDYFDAASPKKGAQLSLLEFE